MPNNPLRSQFPFFGNSNNIYLDSAASSHKPQVVVDSIVDFYTKEYASNHGIHSLASDLNNRIEECRESIAELINVYSPSEIVFTSGATESLNLLASTIKVLKGKKKILVSVSEHHSNILPWQELAHRQGLEIEYFGLEASGKIDLVDLKSKLNIEVAILAITHCSNVLGIINDIQGICELASLYKIITVVDATQSIVHTDVDVRDLGCDFLVFSGHKIYGPTGIGVLYGPKKQLELLNNYKVGGEMVELVTMNKNYYKEIPYRLEAGTINLDGIIGLGTAIQWFRANKEQAWKIERELSQYCYTELQKISGIKFLVDYSGFSSGFHSTIFSFTITGINTFDLAQYLNLQNISVRSGQQCAGILHEYLGIDNSLRVSLGCYNTREDIDKLILALQVGIEKLG